MESEEKPSLAFSLLKWLGIAFLLIVMLAGGALWWLSSLSDVPSR